MNKTELMERLKYAEPSRQLRFMVALDSNGRSYRIDADLDSLTYAGNVEEKGVEYEEYFMELKIRPY